MPINAKCSCGREVNAPDAMAGKTVKCPQCKAPLKIPGGSAAEDDIPVILLKKNRENSGSVKAAKPKRSRKSDNSGAIIGIAVGVVALLLVGGGVAWWMMSGGTATGPGGGASAQGGAVVAPEPGTLAAAINAEKETDETKLIPGDSKAVISFQVGPMLQAPLFKTMLESIGFDEAVKEMQASLKIKPSDIRKMHMVLNTNEITRMAAEAAAARQGNGQKPPGNAQPIRPGTGALPVRQDGTQYTSTLAEDSGKDGIQVAQVMPLYPAQMQPGMQGSSTPPSMTPPGAMPGMSGPGMGAPGGGPPAQEAPFVVIISLAAPVVLEPLPSTITVVASPVANAPGKTYLAQGFILHACPGNQTLVYGQQKYVELLLKSKSSSAGTAVKKLRDLLSKPENHMVMVASAEMSDADRTAAVASLGPKFNYAGPLIEAKTWSLVGSATEDVNFELSGQYPDDAKAKLALDAANRLNKENNTLQTRLGLMAFSAVAGPQGGKAISLLTDAMSQFKPVQEGDQVKLAASLKGAKLKALIPPGTTLPKASIGTPSGSASMSGATPPSGGSSSNTGLFSGGSGGGGAVQAVRGAVARAAGQAEMKQIGLALLAYTSENNGLPPAAIVGPDGKRLLSWRVALLPYLEQGNLHKQFHLNEAWDSPHNIQLLKSMPRQFGGDNSTGMTAVRVFVGGGAAFEWNRKVGLTEISDGTSNTALLADAASGVEWTKPDELEFNASSLPQLGQAGQTTVNVLFADGAVKRVPKNLSPADWKGIITRGGGELVQLP